MNPIAKKTVSNAAGILGLIILAALPALAQSSKPAQFNDTRSNTSVPHGPLVATSSRTLVPGSLPAG